MILLFKLYTHPHACIYASLVALLHARMLTTISCRATFISGAVSGCCPAQFLRHVCLSVRALELAMFFGPGCFEFVFGLTVGLGLGSYNSERCKPCLDDTFHLTKQKSGPAVAAAQAKAAEHSAKARDAASPYLKQVSDSLSRKAA